MSAGDTWVDRDPVIPVYSMTVVVKVWPGLGLCEVVVAVLVR